MTDGVQSTSDTFVAIGFLYCQYLDNCRSHAECTNTNTSSTTENTAWGFCRCMNLNLCSAKNKAARGGSGFHACQYLLLCRAQRLDTVYNTDDVNRNLGFTGCWSAYGCNGDYANTVNTRPNRMASVTVMFNQPENRATVGDWGNSSTGGWNLSSNESLGW